MLKEVQKLALQKSVLVVAPLNNNIYSTVVYTQQSSTYLVERVDVVMNKICVLFGSTLQGRINAARDLFQTKKPVPVLVLASPSPTYIVALPLPVAGNKKDCMWIFTTNFDVVELGPSNSKITIANLSFDVPVSKSYIIEQKNRAHHVLDSFVFKYLKYYVDEYFSENF
ncbi:competence protein ComK [Ureibacillus acetophenoni]|uniref:ComK protein n=1 Tax=Ureibacillus acetophenoni TaxID=614649 RepID=A0A285TYU8_9BACL|nr:competence protein ComK [Ureibacillus acetophenoni]SOC34854.1 ComK protein [Ureibacillus acetophenoni]